MIILLSSLLMLAGAVLAAAAIPPEQQGGTEDRSLSAYESTEQAFRFLQTAFAATQTAYVPLQTQESELLALEIQQTEFARTMDAFYAMQTQSAEEKLRGTPAAAQGSMDSIPASATPQPAAAEMAASANARPEIEASAGQIIEFGSWEQDNDPANGPEPIEWQVIRIEDDFALLLSVKGLEARPWHSELKDTDWSNSSLRAWLNGEFYEKAFGSTGPDYIVQSLNSNPGNPETGDGSGRKTNDRVFLLSLDEAAAWLPSNAERTGGVSAYAEARGAVTSGGYGMWWLRTAGIGAGTSAYVDTDGSIDGAGLDVDADYLTVRPAFWLRMKGYKSGFVPQTPGPTPTPEISYDEWDIRDGVLVKYNGGRSVVSVPDTVAMIGYGAFMDREDLTSVTLPDSVKIIGESAFSGCSGLSQITIPDSVAFISAFAFEDCSSLTSVTIPDSVTSIGSYAFWGCNSLTSVTIPESVSYLGFSAFAYCSSLISVTIPESVTSIDLAAFYGCDKITFHVPENSYAEKWCIENKRIFLYTDTEFKSVTVSQPAAVPHDTWEIKDDILIKYHGSDPEVSIPDDVIYIGPRAFSGCEDLTSVIIPDSVMMIGGHAFSGCGKLNSVKFTDGVMYIDSYAFAFCSSLISVTIPDSVTSIGSHAFWNCRSLISVTIPDSVTSIGDGAFYGCSSLISVTIPDSVTSIGDGAFGDCSSLISVTIPESVTYLGDSAFEDCSSLISVTIPDSVIAIGKKAFASCEALTSVTIPDSVTWMGEDAFDHGERALEIISSPGSYAEQWCKEQDPDYYHCHY